MKLTLKITSEHQISTGGYGTKRETRSDTLVDLTEVEVSSPALIAGLLRAVAAEMDPPQSPAEGLS